jgi:pyruvate-formate lyase
MAENLEKAPAKPCTHFYEALQCMWLVQFALYAVEDYTLTAAGQYFMAVLPCDIESGILRGRSRLS